MGVWAHHVRLEANNQRHADKSVPPPTTEDAEQSLEFAEALGEFLCVLPKRVKRGLIRANVEIEGETTVSVNATVTKGNN